MTSATSATGTVVGCGICGVLSHLLAGPRRWVKIFLVVRRRTRCAKIWSILFDFSLIYRGASQADPLKKRLITTILFIWMISVYVLKIYTLSVLGDVPSVILMFIFSYIFDISTFTIFSVSSWWLSLHNLIVNFIYNFRYCVCSWWFFFSSLIEVCVYFRCFRHVIDVLFDMFNISDVHSFGLILINLQAFPFFSNIGLVLLCFCKVEFHNFARIPHNGLHTRESRL